VSKVRPKCIVLYIDIIGIKSFRYLFCKTFKQKPSRRQNITCWEGFSPTVMCMTKGGAFKVRLC
jgi:hypothetical protein